MGLIMHKGIAYGGGSDVTANPQDAATADLEKLKIDGTTYSVGGADSLSDLTDTAITSPSDGEVLQYDNTDGKWENKSLSIPTVNDNTITIQLNGTTIESFTLNQSSNETINIQVTKSDVGLSNVPNVATDDQTPTVTEASTRANLAVGDSLKTIIGKIKKFFADLKTVAFTGSYTDLSDKPTIPTVNNGTLTIQKNGTDVTTFTANQSSNATANITVPTGDLASINKDGTSSTKYLRGDGTWQAFPSIPAAQVNSDWNASSGVAEILNKPNLATVATSGSYNDLSNKPTIPSAVAVKGDKESTYRTGNVNLTPDNIGAIPSTTYEYNKEISFGSSGKLLIGKFPCYDSNVTIDIDATTSTTYHATIILATQNVNTSHGGTVTLDAYGDENNAITSNIYLLYPSNSRYIEVYFSPASWSKNFVHIRALGMQAAPTNICENVSSIPSTATTQPTNKYAAGSVNYATSAGSATDSTKIPLAGTTALTGSIVPLSDNAVSLGSDTKRFSDIYSDDYSVGRKGASSGVIDFYDSGDNYYTRLIRTASSTSNRIVRIPNEDGTLATREWVNNRFASNTNAGITTNNAWNNSGASVTLSAGTWWVYVLAQFTSTSTAVQGVRLYWDNTGYNQSVVNMNWGQGTTMSTSAIVTISSGTKAVKASVYASVSKSAATNIVAFRVA